MSAVPDLADEIECGCTPPRLDLATLTPGCLIDTVQQTENGTREYTVGVWAGNFDGSPTHRVMSTEGAAPLVRAAYTAIAARYGEPTQRPEARGGQKRQWPQINRWVYPAFTVYFEKSRVIGGVNVLRGYHRSKMASRSMVAN